MTFYPWNGRQSHPCESVPADSLWEAGILVRVGALVKLTWPSGRPNRHRPPAAAVRVFCAAHDHAQARQLFMPLGPLHLLSGARSLHMETPGPGPGKA